MSGARHSPSRLATRKAYDVAAIVLATAATAAALTFLTAVLWTLVARGAAALDLDVFLRSTPPPGTAGGLANALTGSLLLTASAILAAAPLGILAGTYLAEIGPATPLARSARFVNDLLLSAPSIIVGLFVYEAMVVPAGHFSGWAGAAALAVVALPIVVHTTENMLALVPDPLREAAAALGAPRWKAVVAVSWRAASQGILTGVLLAVARISGETAPLLFTALSNQFWSTNLNRPLANLPVVIFQFAMSPYDDWRNLAWAGALLVTTAVLALNVLARLAGRSGRRHRSAP